jgi:hypothetical protein
VINGKVDPQVLTISPVVFAPGDPEESVICSCGWAWWTALSGGV